MILFLSQNRFLISLFLSLVVLDGATAKVLTPRRADDNPEADHLFSESEMVGWVNAQTKFNHGNRQPGSPGQKQNEQFLKGKLEEFGLKNVRLEKVIDPLLLPEQQKSNDVAHRAPDHKYPLVYWEPDLGKSALEAFDQESTLVIPSFPVAHSAPTTADGVEGELTAATTRIVDYYNWRNKPVPQWKGKIVVADIEFPEINTYLFRQLAKTFGYFDPDNTLPLMNHPATWVRNGWEAYQLAVKSGAVGYVGILQNQPGGDYRMYAPYGFKEKDIRDKQLPAVWVSKNSRKDFEYLLKKKLRARITAVAKNTPVEAFNVVGEIPGETHEIIVVHSHIDAPFKSPVEDGSGVAEVLALAKHFASGPRLKRTILIVLSSGHFYASVGTRSFIHSHPNLVEYRGPWYRRQYPRIVSEISIEHVAREAEEGPNGKLVPTDRPEVGAIFASYNTHLVKAIMGGVKKYNVDRTVLLGASGPLGDFPPSDGGDWYLAGIPTINYITNPVYLLVKDGDDEDENGVSTWLASERLTKVAASFAHTIRAIDHTPTAQLFKSDMPVAWSANHTAKTLFHLKTNVKWIDSVLSGILDY